jgi:hypothetical protein
LSSALGSGDLDPAGELAAPFLQRQAPLRIARHDAALAEREAAGVELAVDRIGEGQQGLAQRLGVLAVGDRR